MNAATDVSGGLGAGRTVFTRRPALVMAVVLVATFVINLDTTIVNVAIPALGRELHASTSGQQWVVDAYNLAFAGLILTGGTSATASGGATRWPRVLASSLSAAPSPLRSARRAH
jgi:MFS family permease